MKKEGKFTYIEKGEGVSLILLHGLMGGVDNFGTMVDVVADAGFKVLAPDLKLFKVPLLKTSIKYLAEYLNDFMNHKKLKKAVLVGNSLGGHIALVFSKKYSKKFRVFKGIHVFDKKVKVKIMFPAYRNSQF